jgi:hypothetical protein
LGVTFSGLFSNTTNAGYPNISVPAARNFSGWNSNSTFLISFTQSQSQAAFSLATGGSGTSTFQALLNNSVVDTFSIATDTNNSNNFYGFTGVTFDTIKVMAGGSFNSAFIDNIQFSPATAQNVPEPFSIIGTLVGGTAAFRIRKKLADANKV